MTTRFGLLLGKPPKPGTLLAEVAASLTADGDEVELLLPHEQEVDPDTLLGRDLVVHRGLHTTLAPLLGALHDRGIPLCTPLAADEALRDRRLWRARLAAAGLPLPSAVEIGDWSGVLAAATPGSADASTSISADASTTTGTSTDTSTGEVVVKALSGPGRGAQVLAGTARDLPAEAPFPGPYLVETRLPADDLDAKLYLAGGEVRGLLKPSTLVHHHVTSGTPFTPGPELVQLAREAGRVLDAHLAGVDVLRTPDGPVIVDVNAFPGFRGIEDAAALVAAHLREHARGG